MAFGRSNSLSINTGSGSLFGGNNQSNTSQTQQPAAPFGSTGNSLSQPQQQGSPFGGAANTGTLPNTGAQPQQSGGLFGGAAATSQPQQQSSLFGAAANTVAQPQQSGGLFGGAGNTASQSQQSGGLFGATATNAQPQQPSGSLFGGTGANTQPQQTGGLFGGAGAASQPQPQQSGGLFGGGLGQPQNQTQQSGNSLFGAAGQNSQAQNQQAGGSLFGGLGGQSKPFGGQQSTFGGSIFNPNASTTAPLVGSLTMGQANAAQNTVPGTKIDVSNLRPTTRFTDLHDDLKKQIEAIDTFIRQQESYSAQCEALLPNHSANVDSIKPDVDLITGKIETVELALENDSRAIESAKALVKRDASDLMRCARVTENLTLPSQYHYGPSVTAAARTRASTNTADDDTYDVDLVGYFVRQADAMQSTLETYTSHLAEIESHLRVIEVSTVQQAQQLAAQRTGSRAGGGQDTVRELADTLRGFEQGILGAAGLVGSCREGVNELILGRISGEVRDPQGYGGRRSTRY